MEQRQTKAEDAHERDIETLRQEREQAAKDRVNMRRWIVAAIVIPVVLAVASMTVTIALFLQGGAA